MKVHNIIAILLLILGCTGILQAQEDESGELSDSFENQPIDLSRDLQELQENFYKLRENFDKLQNEVGQLRESVESLARSNSTRNNSGNESVTTSNQEFDIRIVLLVIMVIIIIILIVSIIMMFLKKNADSQYSETSGEHKEEKTPVIKPEFGSETKPLSSHPDSSKKYSWETANRRPLVHEQTSYNSHPKIQSQGLSSSSLRTQTLPAASPRPTQASPPSASMQQSPRPTSTSPTQASPAYRLDDISTLFQSKELRDKRRSSEVVDVYVDLNAENATRITQGEKIAPVFEGGGNFMGAPYVLIQGKDLYPNFYRFNEGRPIPKDKESMLQQIYDIEGRLPGLVDKCIPAQVIPQANQYTILKKGSMVIKTPVQM